MSKDHHWSTRQMLEHAARAVGKVDRLGPRGATTISVVEIEAMACALAALGLVPIPPGGTTPDRLFITAKEV